MARKLTNHVTLISYNICDTQNTKKDQEPTIILAGDEPRCMLWVSGDEIPKDSVDDEYTNGSE